MSGVAGRLASMTDIALQSLLASTGSIGDAYDNAVAESFMGLFENEAIAAGSPFRTGHCAP